MQYLWCADRRRHDHLRGLRQSGRSYASAAASGMTDNVAGMLAYVTFIPAIIFLVTPPYNQSRFVRFHSYQSIFFCVAVFAIQVIL